VRGAKLTAMMRIRDAPPVIKILLTAIVLILLPGAVLSYIGLASVNDRARQLEAGYRGTLSLVRDRIEQEIARLEQQVAGSLDQSGSDLESLSASRQHLQKLSAERPWMTLPFLVSPGGALVTPTVSLGWVQARSRPSFQSAAAADLFARAEAAEFARKDFAGALALYSRALDTVRSPDQRAWLLACTGRCRFKMGGYASGIQDYRQLLSLAEPVAFMGAVPAFVVALSQIADGCAAAQDEKGRIAALQQMHERLVALPWDVPGSESTYYLEQASRELDAYAPRQGGDRAARNAGRPDAPDQRAAALLQMIRRVEWIHATLLPDIRPRATMSLTHVAATREGRLAQFSFVRLGRAALASDDWMLGYELDPDTLLRAVVPPVLETVDRGVDVRVAILDDAGAVRFTQANPRSAALLVTERLSGALPFLTVGLFHANGGSIDQLIRREKATYLAFLVGTLLVMVLGIFLTVRAAAHEVAVSRLKSEFVSNVSHEFKTPLALIRMYGETLESGIVQDEEKRREFYGIIRAESERLTHMVDRVLDFSRIEAGVKPYHFREADLVEVVRHTLDIYRDQIRDRGFAIDARLPSTPIVGRVDPDAIAEALLNLLDNATKYSGDSREIRVTVDREDRQMCLSVKDRGVGIPKDELAKIFDKFYRARATATRETPGSGLGLTLVKHIAEVHGGRVVVESEVGRGSTFTVRIPIRA